MIKYQSTDSNREMGEGPGPGPGPRRPFRNGWGDFKYRNILVIVAFAILLAVVAYAAYKSGETRGIGLGNADRDAFYRQRIAELSGYGAPAQATPGSNGTAVATSASASATAGTASDSINSAQGTLARIDKVDGDKMTVLLLDSKTGTPTGVSLVISLSQQPTVWKSDRTDSTALAPGQNILFIGESSSNNGTYTVRGVLILPLAGSQP